MLPLPYQIKSSSVSLPLVRQALLPTKLTVINFYSLISIITSIELLIETKH